MENLQLGRKCWWSQKEAHWLQAGRYAVPVASKPDWSQEAAHTQTDCLSGRESLGENILASAPLPSIERNQVIVNIQQS